LALNARQEQFCREYIQDYNLTQAAIRAGYSEKTAYSIGSENLKKPEILARIHELQEEKRKSLALSSAMIVTEIMDTYKDCRTRFDSKGALKALAMLTEHVSEIEEPTEKEYRIDPLVIADGFASVRRDILSYRHTEYVLPGGRGSTKSSFFSIEGIEILKNNPQMHMLVLRQVGNTLRDSVYNQMQWAIETLGLNDEFEFKVSPLEITYKPTGQKIYFRGADDPMKIKSIKVPFGYIGVLWFEELDQFKGAESVRSIEQSAIRGGDKAYIFKSFNPPKTANNWANQYIKIPKENRLVHHSTYKGVPAEWLGKVFIDEAEFLRQVNPKAYEHEYEGVPNGTGGAVFDNVVCETITDEQINNFDKIYRGVDWGWFPDPYHYGAMFYDAARLTLYIFDEFRCNKKSNKETADVLINEKKVPLNEVITCDSAEGKSIGDYKSYGLMARGAEKGPGSVDYSMKWLQSLNKIVIDPLRCPETAKEFLKYEYEKDKEGNVISGYPDANNHAIDMVRYAMSPVWKRRGS
jgi:PBSX family phage terminase large subunit